MCHIVYVTLAYLMNKGINRDKKVRVIHCEIAYNIPCSVSTIKLTESFSIRIEHLHFKAFAVFCSFRSRHSIRSHRSLSKRQKNFLKQAEKKKEKSTLNLKFRWNDFGNSNNAVLERLNEMIETKKSGRDFKLNAIIY